MPYALIITGLIELIKAEPVIAQQLQGVFGQKTNEEIITALQELRKEVAAMTLEEPSAP